jgi:hypothetical protein
LKYFYDIGLDSPQKDSRVALAQVEFMTAANFNNIYCFLVPGINTLIDGKVPNYLNTSLKRQIISKCKPQMGPCHNLVIVDPVYKAFTFGSYALDNGEWNSSQLNNELVIIKNKHSRHSISFIKSYCIESLKNYFSQLKLGSTIDTTIISQLILETPGVKGFYINDINGNKNYKIAIYTWNPLYKNEDNAVASQSVKCSDFIFPYFYDINNLDKIVKVIEES